MKTAVKNILHEIAESAKFEKYHPVACTLF